MSDSSVKKAKHLFNKAMILYNNNNIIEALKLFQASLLEHYNIKTEIYIQLCKTHISNSNNPQHYSNSNKQQKPKLKTKEDIECQNILAKKDYYEIFNLNTSSTNEDIKKAYKKMVIKFHPDKNNSHLAEETFKKISQAYQTLTNKEKRKEYDIYRTEEKIKKQFRFQQHKEQYKQKTTNMNTQFANKFQHKESNRHFNYDNNNTSKQISTQPLNNLVCSIPILLIILMSLFSFVSQPTVS